MCDVCGNVPEWVNAPVEEELAAPKKRKHRAKKPAPVERTSRPAASRTASPAPPRAVAQGKPEALPRPAAPPPDRDLLEFFKQWRRGVAQRSNVPAYIVLSDAALEDLCRKQPSNLRELLGVSGIGEHKAELYGRDIFAAFETFRNGMRAAAREVSQVSPADETIQLLGEGKSFEEIAQIRGRQISTVVNMVADLVEKGRIEYRMDWVGEAAHHDIEAAIAKLGSQWLKPLRDALPAEITYEQIRLVVAWARENE
jgi:ATP-dependent DNA helicase RecQ